MKRIYIPFIFFLFAAHHLFATGPWTQRASMGGLGRHRAFSMAIGSRGYVGGGWNGNTMYYDFWEYDPGSNSWTQKAALPALFWSVPAFGIGIYGYVMDGTDTYQYSPGLNTWTALGIGTSWAGDQMKFTVNGKGYIISGVDIYRFDPSTSQWAYRNSLPWTFNGDLAFLANGKGYAVDAYYAETYEYDPATNVITQKSACPAQLSQGCSFGVNGKGYVGTGQVPPWNGDVANFFEYDPATDLWREINMFQGAGRENATAFTIGTKAYVTCGTSGINYNDLWEYGSLNGIEENELNHIALKTFPNPFNEKITLSVPGTVKVENASLCIMNISGQVIKKIEHISQNTIVIERNNMATGMYFYELIIDKNTSACGKFIAE